MSYDPKQYKNMTRSELSESHQMYRDLELESAVQRFINSQGGERRANPEYLMEVAATLYKAAVAMEGKRNGK